MLDDILKIVGNYLIIQVSVILFILPFYLIYRRGHKDKEFNRQLENFFTSKEGNWLVFFWAVAEALIWFIIPEFLLFLVIFMRVHRKRELLYYDIYGTALGTALAFVIHLPQHAIDKLPYVQPGMVMQVQHWYDKHGIFGLAYQPFSGIPYKVFAHLAPDYHFFILTFLAAAILVRISRYFILYAMLSTIYPVLHKYVYRNYTRLFLIGTFVFSMLLLKVYSLYGPGYQVSYLYRAAGHLFS